MNSWIWVIFPDLVKFIERVIECCPAMQVGFFLGCRIREKEFHWTNSPSDTWGRRAEGVKDHLACNTNCFYLPFLHCIVQISARSHHTKKKKKHTTRVDGLWFIILRLFHQRSFYFIFSQFVWKNWRLRGILISQQRKDKQGHTGWYLMFNKCRLYVLSKLSWYFHFSTPWKVP